MTTYEKLKEALNDLDLTDAKYYAAVLNRDHESLQNRHSVELLHIKELKRENARLRDYVARITKYYGVQGTHDLAVEARDILSNESSDRMAGPSAQPQNQTPTG